MNRNSGLFDRVSSLVNIGRTRFNLSCPTRDTWNQGDLVPYRVIEILPGDTFTVSESEIANMMTPIFPIMDNARDDTYAFFVPTRLTWNHTKEFYGEATESAYLDDVTYQIPALTPREIYNDGENGDAFLPGSLWDKMGLPISDGSPEFFGADSPYPSISVLPFRAYHLIWNEWFRDENLQDPFFLPNGDTASPREYMTLHKACRLHDPFSSALPAPQKGPAVELPLVTDTVIPVETGASDQVDNGRYALRFRVANGGTASPGVVSVANGGNVRQDATLSPDPTGSGLYPSNLFVNLEGLTSTSVNAMRLAFATQRIFERLARSGSRFTEWIRSFFSVLPADASLQRPEYLGGQTIAITTKRVVQTSSTNDDFSLGFQGAYSVSGGSKRLFARSFTEPGFLIFMHTTRVQHTYSEGIHRMWTRRNRFDHYVPPLAHIGEVPVYNYQVWAGMHSNVGVPSGLSEGFGYQEAWWEYRCQMPETHGLLRPILQNGLQAFGFVDNYAESPRLSSEWIEEPSTNIGQTLRLIDPTLSDQFIGEFFLQISAVRPLPPRSEPGLIDHY